MDESKGGLFFFFNKKEYHFYLAMDCSVRVFISVHFVYVSKKKYLSDGQFNEMINDQSDIKYQLSFWQAIVLRLYLNFP